MAFSFRKKGNTSPNRGTWGSPFGMLQPGWAKREGAREVHRHGLGNADCKNAG